MKRNTIRYEVTETGRAAVASTPTSAATTPMPCQWAFHCDACDHLLMFCICAKPPFPLVNDAEFSCAV